MSKKEAKIDLSNCRPTYHGRKWLSVRLPTTARDWSDGGKKSVITDRLGMPGLAASLSKSHESGQWHWPKRRTFFYSDLHGDSEAFAASLVASGGVKKTGPQARDFTVNAHGRKANFIIGGDCFDKGPSSLDLLRSVEFLKKQGARVRILAGNHDVRVLFGMRVVGKHKEVANEHFFVRTGEKIIPLLREVWHDYLGNPRKLKGIPSERSCRRRLFPRDTWFDQFPRLAKGQLSDDQLERELSRIHKKVQRFEQVCENNHLDLRRVYAAVEKWKQLFLPGRAEFHWFYKNMRLCYRSGSLLFVHAGIDDAVAKTLKQDGVPKVNRAFRKAIKSAPYHFYYGSLCNCIRTKYRDVDRPFTASGARDLQRAGITAIIHGHRNLHHGQRISFRKSVINFECDTSLDRHTRKHEKVLGRGASVTIIDPQGYILGVSSDYPSVKVFHPRSTSQQLLAKSKS